MQKKTVFFLIIALFCTLSVSAASWDKSTGIGLTYSTMKFIGDQVDRSALGNVTSLSLRYGVSSYVMLNVNAGYGSFKPVKPGSHFFKDPDSPFRTFLFPVHLLMKITPLKESSFKPYLVVGAGALLWDLRNVGTSKVTFYDDHQFRWGQRVSGLRKNAMLCEGLGIEFFLTDQCALDIQALFSTILYLKNDNVGVNDINDQIVQLDASLHYFFGGYKDTDKDGIPDNKDLAPKLAEDFDGFQDEDGAPDMDNDNDGIEDILDNEPLIPEDKDGYMDLDGEPDTDNDNDKILDVNDSCPDDAEDYDGFQDIDGCPDPDNDNDGIPDLEDKCPNEPETLNGYQDSDGCPDTKPAPVVEKQGASLVLEGITFNSGSSVLSDESYLALNKVAESLLANQEVEIEIRGYTDSLGNDNANLMLSQERANTVMQYLFAKGVAASRMLARGYGEKDPLAPNNTKEGRALNRRIEFYRTK
ncbi:MAG TPA: OmpA family protein [bacterium]|nr:OmpA family protein [bacterium]HPN43477.1 OmpA family protein [bacterium]